MKKIFLTALLSTSLLTLGIHADPIRYGVTGGINYFNLKGDSEVADPDFGFTVGGSASWELNTNFALRAELNYVSVASKQSVSGVEFKYKRDYLQLPVLAVVSLTPKARIYGGGYIASLMSSKVEFLGLSGDIKGSTESFTYGVSGGVEYDVSDKLTLGGRYTLSLSNVYKNDSTSSAGFEIVGRYALR